MLGHRFFEAAKHLVAEGNYLDPGRYGGWEHSALVVTLLLILPPRSSAIGAGRCIHMGVSARVNARDVKDHLLMASHEGYDVSAFGDTSAAGTGAP